MRRGKAGTWKVAAGALSLAAHLALAGLVAAGWVAAPTPPEAQLIVVALARQPTPAALPPASPPTARAAAKPAHARPDPAAQRPAAPAALPPAAATEGAGFTDADLAGGPGGGGCDMARRLEDSLRRDPMVEAAAASARPRADSRAILVWNGDWVRSDGEDGKGLSAVREAVVWEVAFAPAACRAEPERGLVLLSLGDAPGAARIALGSDQWRWSDLLRR